MITIKVKKYGYYYVDLIPKLAKEITDWLNSHLEELHLTPTTFNEKDMERKLEEQQRNVIIFESVFSNCYWKIIGYSPPGSNRMRINALFNHPTLRKELFEEIKWKEETKGN